MRILVACEFSGRVRDAFNALGHDVISCDLLPSDTKGKHYQGDVLKLLDGWEPVVFSLECDPNGDGWCYKNDIDPGECKCVGPTQDYYEYTNIDGELFARPIDNPHYDLLIAFPPCTYLCTSGLHWNKVRPWRAQQTEDSLEFVRKLFAAPIERKCIENPKGVISTRIKKPSQMIHPYYFGEDAAKETFLWLENLPKLRPTEFVKGKIVCCKNELKENQICYTCKGEKVPKEIYGNQRDDGQCALSPSDDRAKIRSTTYHGIAEAMADQWNF